MRRGIDDSPQARCDFFTILDGVFEIGVAAVTVHGRTVKQRYVGPSDWGFLAEVKKHVGDRVIFGSGDLFSAEACIRMIEQTGVDGVTIARGSIGNPWIFREARALLAGKPLPDPPTIAEQRDVIRAHFELSLATHGEKLAPRIMRKFGIKYSERHPMAAQVRDAFIKCSNKSAWLAVLDEWYDASRRWPAAAHKQGPGELIAAGATLT